MEKDIVRATIKDFTAGNENLRVIMGTVCLCANESIKSLPETDTNGLIRRVSHATSILIGKRIDVRKLFSHKERFWETDDGKEVNLALENYLEKLKSRKEKLEGENRQVEI